MKMQAVFGKEKIMHGKIISSGYEMETMHIHDVYEIYVAFSSGIKFLVNDRLYELEYGDVMLFTNEDMHKVSVSQKMLYERYIITFPLHIFSDRERTEFLACFAGDDETKSHKIHMHVDEQTKFLALLQTLNEEGCQKDFRELGQKLELCKILLFLNRICTKQRQSVPLPIHSRDERMQMVLEYLDANYHQQITLDELSRLCYLNKYYLSRLFKKEIGVCIQVYITYRRLSAASVLLRERESVSTTARLTGFKSDTFFITTFRKNFGITPYQYAIKYCGGKMKE